MSQEMTMTNEELARKAYETYAGELGIDKTESYRSWERLGNDRKRAWRAVAAVLAAPAELVKPEPALGNGP